MMHELDFDWDEALLNAPTPAYVVDTVLLERNLRRLSEVKSACGAKILLAQKAFSMFALYPQIARHLDGATSSGIYEARLACEEFPGGERHVFSPAYSERDMSELLDICGHIVFNSMSQWERHRSAAIAHPKSHSFGLRCNPQLSTQSHAIYDPCAPGSRLGIRRADMPDRLPDGIRGLHLHTLCEQNSDALERTLDAFMNAFGCYFDSLGWINLGGGHHITRADYDVERLCRSVERLKNYVPEVYLEPGEAVALNCGFLVASVMDILPPDSSSDVSVADVSVADVSVADVPVCAILDASAACHMPDVLEMPYRPHIIGSGEAGAKAHTYRLGGPTCLAGDVIGDYSFERELHVGDKLIFCDMAHYSMVKNNTFNGMPLPAILTLDGERRLKLVRSFDYADFKGRLS